MMNNKPPEIPYTKISNKICSLTKDDYRGFKPCEKNLNVEELVWQRHKGKSNRTILYLQGGPNIAFADGRNSIFPEGDHFYNLFKNDQFLHVKEMQHLKRQIGSSKIEVPLDDAFQETQEYIVILKKIIDHYKILGREVILIGYSYGSLLVNEFLRLYGTIADKTYAIAGRLSCDTKAYLAYTPDTLCLFGEENKINRLITVETRIIAFMAIALAAKDYTKTFDPKIIDKNKVAFVSIEMDEQIGWYQQKEKDWAKKHANLIYITKDELIKTIKEEMETGRIKKEKITNELLLHWGHFAVLWNVKLVKKWLNRI